MKLTIRIEKAEEGGWVGQVEEIPAVIDQGETIEELKANLEEGVRFYLETQRLLFEEENPSPQAVRESLELVG